MAGKNRKIRIATNYTEYYGGRGAGGALFTLSVKANWMSSVFEDRKTHG